MFVQSTVEALYRYGGGWTCMRPCVILCGNDTTLLSTRKLVLEQAGLSVQTVLGVSALKDAAVGAVLVLCYSLSEVEQVKALEQYRSRFPGIKVLVLGGHERAFPSECCKTLTEYPGPKLFLQSVSQLVAESRLS